nr:trehalose-phosphatase [uncultured Caldimonas sp.]
MQSRPTSIRPPHLNAQSALFLDFDGTLADISPTPESVQIADDLLLTLQQLQRALHGAVAIVSGRPIEQLDRLLQPLQLPIAGVHGVERRSADGYLQRLAAPGLERVETAARTLAAQHSGLRVEHKPGAVALHYRQAPDWAERCRQVMEAAVAESNGLMLLHGKMVLEAKPQNAGKGYAIEAYLREPPFLGRHAVFAGDDVTDEAGFAAVQAAGGIAIKIGDGESAATHRLGNPTELRAWLAQAAAALDRGRAPEALAPAT